MLKSIFFIYVSFILSVVTSQEPGQVRHQKKLQRVLPGQAEGHNPRQGRPFQHTGGPKKQDPGQLQKGYKFISVLIGSFFKQQLYIFNPLESN